MRKVWVAICTLLLFVSFAPRAKAADPVTVPISVEVNGKTVITITPDGSSPAYPTPSMEVENTATLNFSFDAPGEYSYRVKQAGTDPTIYYDDTEYVVQVQLSLNSADQLEGNVRLYKVGSTEKEAKIVFINSDVAPITDDPPVEKQIKGSPDSPAAFTFVMEAVTAGAPMPEGSSGGKKNVTITGAGSVEFGEIKFTLAGTYEYTIKEQTAGADGYTYDTAIYTLRYQITEADGVLSKTRTILKNGQATDAMKAVFVNEYTKTETETRTITRTIYYKEYDENGNEVSTPVEQPVTLVRTKTTNPDGTVTYGPWEISGDGAPGVDSPPYPGWTPDKGTVPPWDIDLTDPKDETILVVYTPGSSTETETRTITRTIYYKEYDKDGKEIFTPIIQTVTLIRTKTTNPDGTVTYGPWNIEGGDVSSVKSSNYPGWKPDQTMVGGWKIDLNNPQDEVIMVVYTPASPQTTTPAPVPHGPEMGDTFNMILWVALGLLALGGIVVLLLGRSKKDDKEEE